MQLWLHAAINIHPVNKENIPASFYYLMILKRLHICVYEYEHVPSRGLILTLGLVSVQIIIIIIIINPRGFLFRKLEVHSG